MRKRVALAALTAALILAIVQAGPAHVHQVIMTIISDSLSPDPPARQHEVDEQHLNAYISYQLRRTQPPGVREFSVKLLGNNRFSTFARVDLEEAGVADELPGLISFMLSGDQELEVEGHLEVDEGWGRYQVEGASLNGIPIPASVINSMIRSAGQRLSPPVDPTDRFALPYRIREVQIEPRKLKVETGVEVAQ